MNDENAEPWTTRQMPFWQALLVVLAIPVALFLLVLLGIVIVEAWPKARVPATRIPCQNNLKQIGLAMNNYHSALGSFPPAAIVDAAGRPAHGWRLLLAPYLAGGMPTREYHFDEAWNSPGNLKACATMPTAFRCPQDEGPAETTSYIGVVGPEFFFDESGRACTNAMITDGLSSTIAVVECSGQADWRAPQNMTWAAFLKLFRARKVSSHDWGFNALLADGSVHFLDYRIDERDLLAMFTVNGGERLLRPGF